MKLNENHRAILERGATGFSEKYVTRWFINGVSVTREAKTLMRHGLADAMYFSGGRGSLQATDAGKAELAKVTK